MSDIVAIVRGKAKANEKVAQLATLLTSDKRANKELLEFYSGAKLAEQSLCWQGLELATRTAPKLAGEWLTLALKEVSNKAPAVKREASRVVANAAREFPDTVAKAVPALLANIDDEGTVIRWSAALALGEIAKYHPQSQAKLVPLFEQLVETEENGGVKNHYVKALKAIANTNIKL